MVVEFRFFGADDPSFQFLREHVVVTPISDGLSTPGFEVTEGGTGVDADRFSVIVETPATGWYFVGFSELPSTVVVPPPRFDGLGWGTRTNPDDVPTLRSVRFCPGDPGALIELSTTERLSIDPGDVLIHLDTEKCGLGEFNNHVQGLCPFPLTSTSVIDIEFADTVHGFYSGTPLTLLNGATTGSFTFYAAEGSSAQPPGCLTWTPSLPSP